LKMDMNWSPATVGVLMAEVPCAQCLPCWTGEMFTQPPLSLAKTYREKRALAQCCPWAEMNAHFLNCIKFKFNSACHSESGKEQGLVQHMIGRKSATRS
jgi:hypothetical protein